MFTTSLLFFLSHSLSLSSLLWFYLELSILEVLVKQYLKNSFLWLFAQKLQGRPDRSSPYSICICMLVLRRLDKMTANTELIFCCRLTCTKLQLKIKLR